MRNQHPICGKTNPIRAEQPARGRRVGDARARLSVAYGKAQANGTNRRSIKAKAFGREVTLQFRNDDIGSKLIIVYMVFSLLYYSHNGLSYCIRPSPKQIVAFIKVFGGQTLRIPTRGNFSWDHSRIKYITV